MRALDRIVLVVLALGVWALVLSPQETGARRYYDDRRHSCGISGEAYGYIDDLSKGGRVVVKKWFRVNVRCTHN